MNRVESVTGPDGTKYVAFKCPGCQSIHALPITGPRAWGFNNNLELPTLTPSILCRYHAFNEETDEYDLLESTCHSFVKEWQHSVSGRLHPPAQRPDCSSPGCSRSGNPCHACVKPLTPWRAIWLRHLSTTSGRSSEATTDSILSADRGCAASGARGAGGCAASRWRPTGSRSCAALGRGRASPTGPRLPSLAANGA